MKLYSVDLSPFAACVRAAIYHKCLPVELVPPPATGLGSPEYLALNPMGKIPLLVLDDGSTLPESETIIEYIEDAFPVPSLRPERAEDLARARLLARITEVYVNAPMFLLFPQLAAASRDAGIVDSQLKQVDKGLGYLSHYLADGNYAFGDRLTTADCCVFPMLYLVQVVSERLGRPGMLEEHPRVLSYYRKTPAEPVLRRVLDEMVQGMKAAGYAS